MFLSCYLLHARDIVIQLVVSIFKSCQLTLQARQDHLKQPSELDHLCLCLQIELEHEREKRQGERVGRIRTAKELNKLTVQLQLLQEAAAAAGLDSKALTQASTSKGTVVPSYPLKPLGTLQSCFTTR